MNTERTIDFDRVWREGTKRVGRYTVVYYAYGGGVLDRKKNLRPLMGCIATKKARTAVVRNKIKRWYRHIFRDFSPKLPENLSMIWIARSTTERAGYQKIEEELRNILGKEGFDCETNKRDNAN